MRLDPVYNYIDQKLRAVSDDDARCGLYAHIHGVATLSQLYAMKRGLNVELAVAAALLHDIAAVVNSSYDNHAEIGARIAREFLSGLGSYGDEEICIIVTAVERHTSDPRHFQAYDALLSEADFMQQHMRDFTAVKSNTGRRKLAQLFAEMGIECSLE